MMVISLVVVALLLVWILVILDLKGGKDDGDFPSDFNGR